MSELAKSWPVGGWILRLFINLMKKLTGQNVGCGSKHDRGTQDESRAPGNSGVDSSSAAARPRSNKTLQMGPGLSNLIQEPVENGQSSARVDEWNELQQTDQLLSDVIWAPDQTNFDFGFLFEGQPNGSLPFNFGSLVETVVPEYVGPGI